MNDALELLRLRFIARCEAELDQLRMLAPNDPELGSIAHRLSGSAGSFGYPRVSETAALVEDRIRSGTAPAPDEIQALIHCLETAVLTGYSARSGCADLKGCP